MEWIIYYKVLQALLVRIYHQQYEKSTYVTWYVDDILIKSKNHCLKLWSCWKTFINWQKGLNQFGKWLKNLENNDSLILFKSDQYPVNNYGGQTTRIIEITEKSSIIVSIHQIERRNFIGQLKTRISNLEYTGMFMNLFDNVGDFRVISRD